MWRTLVQIEILAIKNGQFLNLEGKMTIVGNQEQVQ